MKTIFSIVISILMVGIIHSVACAQAPEIVWQNTIGGSSNDGINSLQQTSDGGYILGGWSDSDISGDKIEGSLGGADYWIVKVNSAGAIEWQKTVGGSGDDILYAIEQTSDGGFILGGYSYSGISGDKTEDSLGLGDYWIVKLNNAGSIEWQNTIGGSDFDRLLYIQQTSDEGYILGGYSTSGISGDKEEESAGNEDYWVVKVNSGGAIEWQNTIGGSALDELWTVQQTSNGGYILAGYSESGISGDKAEASLGSYDFWVVKLYNTGNIEWQNTIGGSSWDALYSIQSTSDGGYVLGGNSDSDISGDKTEGSLGGGDYWVLKLNSAGIIEWQNTIGGNEAEGLYRIQLTSDGGYILGGDSYSGISGDKTEASLGGLDYWIVKLNNNGDIEWENTIGGSDLDVLTAIQETFDGGYVIVGVSRSDISGDKTEDNIGTSATFDMWVIKLQATTSINELTIANSTSTFPNPAKEFIIFDLSNVAATQSEIFIYNSSGVLLKQFSASHSTQLQIPVDEIGNDGMYFYTVRTDDQQFFAGKFIIQR